MDIFNLENVSQSNIIEQSPIALAFLGDSVHTLFVRNYLLKNTTKSANNLHGDAIKFCKATYQAKIFDKLFPLLTEYEQNLCKRARNCKTNNVPKNTDLEHYKKATCYECLIGYLWLVGDNERLNFILDATFKENL